MKRIKGSKPKARLYPNGSVTIAGLSLADYMELVTSAALYHYDEIAKGKSVEYHKKGLIITKAIEESMKKEFEIDYGRRYRWYRMNREVSLKERLRVVQKERRLIEEVCFGPKV